MLNATLCATGRAICCLLETYQEADGVRVPEVLVPFMGGITFMPFVRESKLPEKAAGGKAASPAPAAAAKPAAAPKADAAPKAAAPAPAAAAAPATEKAAAPAAPAAAVEKKEAAPKPAAAPAAPKVDKSKPPATPVLPPSYTTPAPQRSSQAAAPVDPTATPAGVPAAADVMGTDGRVVLDKLEKRLQFFSYVGGFLPSAEDRKVLEAIKQEQVDATIFPNVARWSRNVVSFKPEAVAAWV